VMILDTKVFAYDLCLPVAPEEHGRGGRPLEQVLVAGSIRQILALPKQISCPRALKIPEKGGKEHKNKK